MKTAEIRWFPDEGIVGQAQYKVTYDPWDEWREEITLAMCLPFHPELNPWADRPRSYTLFRWSGRFFTGKDVLTQFVNYSEEKVKESYAKEKRRIFLKAWRDLRSNVEAGRFGKEWLSELLKMRREVRLAEA